MSGAPSRGVWWKYHVGDDWENIMEGYWTVLPIKCIDPREWSPSISDSRLA